MDTPRPRHPSGSRALALLLLLGAARSEAHQFWLTPSRYDARAGQPVEVGAVAGVGFRGERQPWSPPHLVRFAVRAARTLDLSPLASPGDPAWARFAASDAGGALIAFESSFTPVQLPAAAFDAYLADEGLHSVLQARRTARATGPGRERFRRCAKLWLPGGDAARATEAVGLPLELLPLEPPGASARLRVRLLLSGRPLAGARIKAWRAPLVAPGRPADVSERDSLAVTWEGRSDAHGEFVLPCAAAGEWMISTVHMVPCAVANVADWESTWASLSFVRAAGQRTAR